MLKLITGLNLKEISNSTDEEFLNCLLEKKLNAADMSSLIAALVDLAKVANSEALDFNAIDLAKKALYIDAYVMKSQKTVYYGNANSVEQARNLIDEKR